MPGSNLQACGRGRVYRGAGYIQSGSLQEMKMTAESPWWLRPGKESTCNAGDPSSNPGLGLSAGEGIGYPPQYSWASLVAQMVKNPPAVWETWVRSLGWEDRLEQGMAICSGILAWRIPMDTGAWQATLMGSQRVGHD